MPRRSKIDPRARNAALAIAAARMAIGVGGLLATRPALRVLGFAEVGAPAEALAKLAGGRDLALGVLVLLARDDRRALSRATFAAAAVDAADAASFARIAARGNGIGRAGPLGALSGAAAAAGGLWAARRLSPGAF